MITWENRCLRVVPKATQKSAESILTDWKETVAPVLDGQATHQRKCQLTKMKSAILGIASSIIKTGGENQNRSVRGDFQPERRQERGSRIS